jgi:hypothetical protein
MDALQGRMDKVQGNMGDPNATGADRAGMGWRQERRQAKRDGSYDPNAQPQDDMIYLGGSATFDESGGGYGMGGNRGGWGGFGGGMPGMGMYGHSRGVMPGAMGINQGFSGFNTGNSMSMPGGMQSWGMGGMGGGGMGGMGGYNPPQGGQMQGSAPAPQGAQRPGMEYRQDRRQARRQGGPEASSMPQPQQGGWNPLTTPTSMGNVFQTGWGNLVPSSTGNQNVFQREGDPSMLFHYDPNAADGAGAKGGWKSMTPDAYSGYGDYNYQDPRQFGAAANPMMQHWTQKNGLIQGMVGTGSYS